MGNNKKQLQNLINKNLAKLNRWSRLELSKCSYDNGEESRYWRDYMLPASLEDLKNYRDAYINSKPRTALQGADMCYSIKCEYDDISKEALAGPAGKLP
jgi:hypothetical protein